MFLHHLSVEQQQAFVGLAQWLVEADGRIDPLESARLAAIHQQVGVGPPSSGEPMDWAACFSTQRARTSALLGPARPRRHRKAGSGALAHARC